MNESEAYARLKKLENVIAACNRCGFCTSYCPTYNATGSEVHSPRGRNQMVRALIEGKVGEPAQLKASVDTCLLCGECTSVCFSEVPTAQIMMEARHYIGAAMGVPKFLDLFLRVVLPDNKKFRALLRAAFIGKRFGISAILRKFGLLGRISPELAAGDEILDKAPRKFLLENPAARKYYEEVVDAASQAKGLEQTKAGTIDAAPESLPQRPKVAYMPVCGSQYIRPDIGLATLRLFEKIKTEFIIPDVICCGLPAASYGVLDQTRAIARENIQRLERGRFESIIVDDSSCGAHLKDYAQLFQDDPHWLKRAHDIAQKIRELSVTFAQRGLREHLRLAPWTGGVVAYHDPCKAQYGQKLINPPRELLASIPRLTLVPVKDADQCCGGAGTYSVAHPDMSRQVLDAKIKNIIATNCKIVITSSASCLLQLRFGLRRHKSNIEALHLSEFLVRALEQRR